MLMTYLIWAVFIFVLIKEVWKQYRKNYEETEYKRTIKALQLYVRTGTKTMAFHHADRSSIASAERARLKVIEEQRRTVENENIQFKAWQQCPKCKYFNVHFLRFMDDGRLNGRVCRNCGNEWHTVG